MLTPAISVLSAVEGLAVLRGLSGRIDRFILPMRSSVDAVTHQIVDDARVGERGGIAQIAEFVLSHLA